MWDPVSYQRFTEERGRPFDELLARVPAVAPTRVVDLGCGPGTQTVTLLDRWPAASVVGVDSSAEMVAAARARSPDPRLTFVHDDLRTWRPERPVDMLVANATLQWVPGHLDLLPALAGHLTPDGWLAFQVPGNYDQPSHRLLAQLRGSPRWRDRLGAGVAEAAVHEPATYLSVLAGLGLTVDAWATTYLHVLDGTDAVLDWTLGTTLRPVLARLDEDERAEFVAEYAALLRPAYPRQRFGTVFPFRRIFVVAHRGAAC